MLIPASTAVGTASGAAIGAVKAESKEASAAKAAMLRQAAATVSYQQALTSHLQQQTQSRLSIALALVDADRDATASGTPLPWLITVGLDEISAASDVADQPFGIWVGVHVELRRPGTTAAV